MAEDKPQVKRWPKPTPPDGWDTILNPEDDMRKAHSFSYFPYSQVSSALQKSVRRCQWPEAAFWLCEAYRTGPKCVTNIVRRMFIMCSEDIGPANPSLILLVDDFFDPDVPYNNIEKLKTALSALEVMVKSPKDRTLDWCHSIRPHETFAEVNTEMVYDQLRTLRTSLQEKSFDKACSNATRLYQMHEQGKDFSLSSDTFGKWKKEFNCSTIVRHYKKISSQFWLPVLEVATQEGANEYMCMLVHRLYHICCVRGGKLEFRNMKRGDMKTFWMHACWAICNPSKIEETWYAEGDLRITSDLDPDGWEDEIMQKHLSREMFFEMPDYAVDQHTAPITKETAERGTEHFVLHGSLIHNASKETKIDQRYYLKRAIALYKSQGRLAEDFKLPPDYFEHVSE